MSNKKIIAVIDDDPIYRYVMENMMRRLEMQKDLQIFDDPQTAIDFWTQNQQQQPTTLFLDINMHHTNGWEFLDLLMQKDFKRIEIFMVSSSPLLSDIETAKSHPYQLKGYIFKPFKLEKIQAALAHNNSNFLILE